MMGLKNSLVYRMIDIKKRLRQSFKLWCIGLMGFASGLPFLLILSTLHIWLKESGFSNATIGLLVMATLPYSFKFALAPMFNAMRPPLFYKSLGHHKGWILWAQVGIIIGLVLLAYFTQYQHIIVTSLIAFGIALCSAVQDIYIEAYRIQLVDQKDMSLAASLSGTGYRVAMWVSGAGALYLASITTWQMTYILMAGCMIAGSATTLFCPHLQKDDMPPQSSKALGLRAHIKNYMDSFRTLMHWRTVLVIIIGFKLIDTFLNVMAAPFMMDVGFSKMDIATVGKTFGIGAMILGGLCSGLLLRRYALFNMFIMCTVLQCISGILCCMQVKLGADLSFLYLSMGFEHFASGAAATVFITFLSLLSRDHNTAVVYAMLTSIASLLRIMFSHLAGITVDCVGWQDFFVVITVMCVGFIVILYTVQTRQKMFSSLPS